MELNIFQLLCALDTLSRNVIGIVNVSLFLNEIKEDIVTIIFLRLNWKLSEMGFFIEIMKNRYSSTAFTSTSTSSFVFCYGYHATEGSWTSQIPHKTPFVAVSMVFLLNL